MLLMDRGRSIVNLVLVLLLLILNVFFSLASWQQWNSSLAIAFTGDFRSSAWSGSTFWPLPVIYAGGLGKIVKIFYL